MLYLFNFRISSYGIEAHANIEKDELAITVKQLLVKEQPRGTNPCAYEALKNLLIAYSALTRNALYQGWIGDNIELAFLSDQIREQLFGPNVCENWRGTISKKRSVLLGEAQDAQDGENLYPEEVLDLWNNIKNEGFFSDFKIPPLTIIGSAFDLENVEVGARDFDLQSCKDILALREKLKKTLYVVTQFIDNKEQDIEVDPYEEFSDEPLYHAFIVNTGEEGNAHWFGALFRKVYRNECELYLFDSLNHVRVKGDPNVDRLIRAIFNKEINFSVPKERLNLLEDDIKETLKNNDFSAYEFNAIYKQLGGTKDFSADLEKIGQ